MKTLLATLTSFIFPFPFRFNNKKAQLPTIMQQALKGLKPHLKLPYIKNVLQLRFQNTLPSNIEHKMDEGEALRAAANVNDPGAFESDLITFDETIRSEEQRESIQVGHDDAVNAAGATLAFDKVTVINKQAAVMATIANLQQEQEETLAETIEVKAQIIAADPEAKLPRRGFDFYCLTAIVLTLIVIVALFYGTLLRNAFGRKPDGGAVYHYQRGLSFLRCFEGTDRVVFSYRDQYCVPGRLGIPAT